MACSSRGAGGCDGEAFTDASERRRASRARAVGARARRRARSRPRSPAFAHDIRTPLTGILALAELLAASDLGERERRWAHGAQERRRASGALTTLIVDAAKADARRPDAAARAVLAARARESLAGHRCAARAQARALKAEVDIAAGLPGARSPATRCGCARRWRTSSTTR